MERVNYYKIPNRYSWTIPDAPNRDPEGKVPSLMRIRRTGENDRREAHKLISDLKDIKKMTGVKSLADLVTIVNNPHDLCDYEAYAPSDTPITLTALNSNIIRYYSEKFGIPPESAISRMSEAMGLSIAFYDKTRELLGITDESTNLMAANRAAVSPIDYIQVNFKLDQTRTRFSASQKSRDDATRLLYAFDDAMDFIQARQTTKTDFKRFIDKMDGLWEAGDTLITRHLITHHSSQDYTVMTVDGQPLYEWSDTKPPTLDPMTREEKVSQRSLAIKYHGQEQVIGAMLIEDTITKSPESAIRKAWRRDTPLHKAIDDIRRITIVIENPEHIRPTQEAWLDYFRSQGVSINPTDCKNYYEQADRHNGASDQYKAFKCNVQLSGNGIGNVEVELVITTFVDRKNGQLGRGQAHDIKDINAIYTPIESRVRDDQTTTHNVGIHSPIELLFSLKPQTTQAQRVVAAHQAYEQLYGPDFPSVIREDEINYREIRRIASNGFPVQEDAKTVRVIVTQRDKVLLLQKAETSKAGPLWELPGGNTGGLQLTEAAQKELNEETRLDIPQFRVIQYGRHTYTTTHTQEQKDVGIALVRVHKKDVPNIQINQTLKADGTPEDNHQAYGWFTLRQVRELEEQGKLSGSVPTNMLTEILWELN